MTLTIRECYGETMKNSKKMTCALAGILLAAVLTPTAASANVGPANSNSVYKSETITQADGGTLTITQKAVTAEDFPVVPDVGESISLRYSDRKVLVERVTAACTLSYSAYTPIKQHNRAQVEFRASASAGCPSSVSLTGYIRRINVRGGATPEGYNSTTLQPGWSTRFLALSGTCRTGWNTTWNGSIQGQAGASATLPCGFL